MRVERISFSDWQERFATEAVCADELARIRWPQGFQCPRCGGMAGWGLSCRRLWECRDCRHQTSVTAGTVLHGTKLPLTRWLWALYWMASDKGGISALRLAKLIGVTWRTAFELLRKLRMAMGHRDSLYRLTHCLELDEAYVGGSKPRHCPAHQRTKRPIVVACEVADGKPRFIAIEAIAFDEGRFIKRFAARHILPDTQVRTDGSRTLRVLAAEYQHRGQVTPPDQVKNWLPWVHIVISNLKRFLLGTFHGVTRRYLKDYIHEFVYRFNRRFWEPELPNRLLHLALAHAPIKLT